MNILLLEPFFTGSHQKWAEGYQAHSRHKVDILSLPGRHWKWRMHGGAPRLAEQFLQRERAPALFLASDMLDVATFLGLCGARGRAIPALTYFHENQITYPWSPKDEDVALQRDRHYGFINYTTALASTQLLFNSDFHRRSFLEALPAFLRRFPDEEGLHTVEKIAAKSQALPLGMNLRALNLEAFPEKYPEATLLWNHRWEYDKGPELFFETLFRFKEEGLAFRLIVLGKTYRQAPSVFQKAREKLREEIVHFGYADSPAHYARLLWQADLLPVTSRQDFFGGSVIEALYCQCFPILPDRLAYPEHFPEEERSRYFYQTEEGFRRKLREAILNIKGIREQPGCRHFAARYDWSILAGEYDALFQRFAGNQNHSL